MITLSHLIYQQACPTVIVHYKDIGISVVIDVSECRSTPNLRQSKNVARLSRYFFKVSVCKIVKKLPIDNARELLASCRHIYDNGKFDLNQKCYQVLPFTLEHESC